MASPITIPGFVQHLADLYDRMQAYHQMQNRLIPNEYALSNTGVYPGAAYDFARHGTDLSGVQFQNPGALAALVAILRSGQGLFRG